MILKRNTAGFTLVEIMIVVAIIGLLAAIAVPNFTQARSNARKSACINNLRLIDAAKEQDALENNLDNGDAAANVTDYLKGNVMPTCPTDAAVYVVGNVGADPTCPNAAAGHVL